MQELLIEKIAIIGPSGAGKTTLARALSSILKIKAIHLDRLFWERDWRGKTQDTRISILEELVREKQWIIEGTYLKSSEPRLDAADTIIILDIPVLLCLIRVIKRHLIYHGQPRRDLPMECTDELNLKRLWRLSLFPAREGKALEHIQQSYAPKCITLRSSEEVDIFLAQVKQEAEEKQYSTLLR